MTRPLRIMTAALGLALLAQCDSAATSAGGAAAPAAEASAASEQNLMAAWGEFERAFAADDFPRVVGAMPPRVLDEIGVIRGQSPAKLRRTMIAQMEEVMREAEVHSVRAAPPPKGVQSANGLPYAILPTTTDMSVYGTRHKNTTNTVALFDDGKWYFVRIADKMADRTLKAAYPELSGLALL